MTCRFCFRAWAVLSVLLAPGSFASIPPETADTIRALLTTTEQQAQSIKRLQRDVTALKKVVQIQGTELKSQENAIAIVTNKINNHSLPVAFTARFTADIEAGIVIGLNQILQFDDVVTNVGNGYDPYTGIFTAPVPGNYAIFLTIMGTGARDGTLKIEKGGAPLNYVHTMPSLNQGSTLVTSHFRAGEKVFIRQNSQVAIRGSWYTVFSGFLIHAD